MKPIDNTHGGVFLRTIHQAVQILRRDTNSICQSNEREVRITRPRFSNGLLQRLVVKFFGSLVTHNGRYLHKHEYTIGSYVCKVYIPQIFIKIS